MTTYKHNSTNNTKQNKKKKKNNNNNNNNNNLCKPTCQSISNIIMFNWSNNKKKNNDKNNKLHEKSLKSGHGRFINYDYDDSKKNGGDGGGGTLLYKAIEERQWKSVLSRLTMCPHEVSTFVYR